MRHTKKGQFGASSINLRVQSDTNSRGWWGCCDGVGNVFLTCKYSVLQWPFPSPNLKLTEYLWGHGNVATETPNLKEDLQDGKLFYHCSFCGMIVQRPFATRSQCQPPWILQWRGNSNFGNWLKQYLTGKKKKILIPGMNRVYKTRWEKIFIL